MNHPTTLDLIYQSDTLIQRFEAVAERAAQAALDLYGVQLEPGTLAAMGSVKAAVMGNQPLGADFDAELAGLEQCSAVTRKRALEAGSQAVKATNLEEVLMISDRSRRMAEARRLGLDTPGKSAVQTELTMAERTKLLLTLPPAARISAARKWGLA